MYIFFWEGTYVKHAFRERKPETPLTNSGTHMLHRILKFEIHFRLTELFALINHISSIKSKQKKKVVHKLKEV